MTVLIQSRSWKDAGINNDDDLFDNDNDNDNNLNKWVRETGTSGIITLLQKGCLLGTEKNIAKNPKQLRLWVIA